ncbi:MAG TPA: GxxExxY protein [Bacteroidales bacterium]
MPDLLEQTLVYKDEAYKIIGAAMAVHRELGPGFLEGVYQEALEIEFNQLHISFQREVPLTITYKEKTLQKEYVADFICYNKIIVELKAIDSLVGIHEAQVINYLKTTGFKLGLLINFGEESLTYKRLIRH